MTTPVSAPAGIQAVTVLAGGEDTDGHLGLVEETLGGDFDGPPLHVHPDFDELFVVLDGQLIFQVGDGLTPAGAGDWLLARRGTAHTFANHSGRPARVLIAVTPAGFERYFRLISAQLAGIEPPDDVHGPRPITNVVGPPIPRPARG